MLFLQHLPWRAVQPLRLCDSYRGDVVFPGEQDDVLATTIPQVCSLLRFRLVTNEK